MTPHAGDGKLDREIQTVQDRVSEARDPRPYLERLGWLYVAKARASHDRGFYKLAEQCALALKMVDSNSPEAMLLQGHLLISFHRFAEAESIARELVSQRTLAFDHGLLGDALMEQGRLTEAVSAYQSMVDLRPGLQSYVRIAHIRWLKGDLEGAIEAAGLAARAASPLDPESASWALSRLGYYQLLAGSVTDAKEACDAALRSSPDYPAALLLQSRLLLATDQAAQAVEPARRAVEIDPLPEFQWALADTLRAVGRTEDATNVEALLKRTGAKNDPRTFALFLATRGEQVELAVDLAQREFQSRSDIFTHDALAWALTAAGRTHEAWPHVERAVSEGTMDGRLLVHAGVVAVKLGHAMKAKSWLSQAQSLERTLLPSEREHLAAALAALAIQPEAGSINPATVETISAREDQISNASSTNKNKGQNQ